MKSKRKTNIRAGSHAAFFSFLLFGLVALAIVAGLEFLDHRAGRYSFIFDKVLGLERKTPATQGFDRDLKALLARQKISHDVFRDEAGVTHFKIDLTEILYEPLRRNLRRLVEKYGGSQALSEVQGMKNRVIYLYQVHFDGRLTHLILIGKQLAARPPAPDAVPDDGIRPVEAPRARPLKTPTGKTTPAATPRLAIVIDDIGYADLVSDQLRELGIPISGAVIPDAPHARSEARRLHESGLEVIIHLPMQSKNNGNHHPRGRFILADSGVAEIEALLQRAVEVVPFAHGVNNHMGSLLTSDPQAMRRVLERIKARGMFFVDSRTAPTTVAHALAREMGIRTAKRDVFLDDVQDYEHSRDQLRLLVQIARRNGRALAIGHPFPTTLDALRDSVSWLKRQPVEIVFVSGILE